MKDDTFATCLGYIFGIAVLIVVGTLLNGWALETIWNWFIPPIFGITSLTLWKAIGVSMVFSLFNGTKPSSKDSNSGKSASDIFTESFITITMTPALTVVIAWIVLQFAF
jgi:hypothetical protein